VASYDRTRDLIIDPVIEYSTYLGGATVENAAGITLDSSGAAYIVGDAPSGYFPLVNPIPGAGGASQEAFITKIAPSGTAIVYSTLLGGSSDEYGEAVAVDSSGAAYVTGWTTSSDFPLASPLQGTLAGTQDAFVTKINPSGSALVYSTYLGGSGYDYGMALTIDMTGAAYLTGATLSYDFPLVNPIQNTMGGPQDVFITKIGGTPLPVVTLAFTPDTTSVARGSALGYVVTATNTTATRQCFNYWENVTLPNGSTHPSTGSLIGPLHLCLNPGESKTGHLTHGLPMSAPLGTYTFNAFTGAYPVIVVGAAHFTFDVTAFGPMTKTPETSWRLIENGFRK